MQKLIRLMATFIPGGNAASISGSIGGVVYSKNNTMRNKTIPVQPDTESQMQARANFGANATLWLSLSLAAQQAWITLGAALSRHNRQGVSYTPTGRQVFMEFNQNLVSVGEDAISAAPAVGAFPVVPGIAVATVHPDAFSVTLTDDIAGTVTARVYATGVRRPGVKFNKGFRLIGTIESGSGSEATVMTAAYLAAFGAPAVGMRIQVKVDFVDVRTGHASPATKLLVTVS